MQDPLFSPHWLSLLCPDGSVPCPGAQSPAAGLLCNLQYLLVTSGLSFPSENQRYYFLSCTVSLPGLWEVCFISLRSLEATSTQAPGYSFWDMLGLIVQSWQLWPRNPTPRPPTLSPFLASVSLLWASGSITEAWGKLRRVCQVPAHVLRGTGKEGQGEVWMKVAGGPLLWAGA